MIMRQGKLRVKVSHFDLQFNIKFQLLKVNLAKMLSPKKNLKVWIVTSTKSLLV